MKKTINKSKSTLIALGAVLSLISRGQEAAPDHAATNNPDKKGVSTFEAGQRATQKTSQYDALIEKLQSWTTTSEDGSHTVEVAGDELTVRLSSLELQSSIESIKKVKKYRDAVDKQCRGIDPSATLLINTIDHCLVNNVILPAVNKSRLELNRYETKISSKAINVCHDEIAAFFAEKEKRTDLTEKEHFAADRETAKSLSYIFESFGAKKDSKQASSFENSELVKAVQKVEANNLCAVKLDSSKEEPKTAPKTDSKPKADSGESLPQIKQNRSEYEESIEETFEEEEIYEPLAPKKVTEAPKPAQVQPAPQPAPVYQPSKPTYQPVPYKPKSYEPAPAPKQRNTPPAFIPAAAPAPRRALVNGPGPVPVAGVPIARSFGLSLGFGSYNSTITGVPPMPYPPMYPPMPMAGTMPMAGGLGGISGVSSAPVSRACLVCSSTPTVMPTLGLANMMARPCNTQVVGMRPVVGACLPNMNQPVIGYMGVNPAFTQIPRYPGAPVVPGTVNQPSIGGGSISPTRTTVPRTSPSLVKSSKRRIRR